MTRGRIGKDAERRRSAVEAALGGLAEAVVVLDALTIVRVRQAMERDCSLEPLLQPALDELDNVRDRIETAKDQFSDVWQSGQGCRWQVEEE
jgi:hypothetical protein